MTSSRPVAGTARPPRIAIAQLQMHWTIDANLAAMLAAMQLARDHGATVCAFAELAVTGFHREIVALARPELVAPALAQIRAQAQRLGLAVAFGAPTFDADGSKRNSHLLIDEAGQTVAVIDKNGLTAPEATFFAAGSTRPSARLQGLSCSAVICREIEDQDQVLQQLRADPPQLVFWPGSMRPDPAKPITDPPAHVMQAQALAQAAGAYVIQNNWPNALNRPEESQGAGRSACIAPSGTLLFRLPVQGFGVAVFDLGSTAFDWHPQ